MRSVFRFLVLTSAVGYVMAASSLDENAIQQAQESGDQVQAQPSGADWFLPVIMGAMLLMIVFSFRGQRKEPARRWYQCGNDWRYCWESHSLG